MQFDIIEKQNEIEMLIKNIFNYYNGKINNIIKAKLIIDWRGNYITNEAGCCIAPGIVYIFPMAGFRYCPTDYNIYKQYIVMTVLHELHHVDQYIIERYNTKQYPEYQFSIEAPVEVHTNIFIANHINEIHNLFGVDMSEYVSVEYPYTMQRYDVGLFYRRMTYMEVVFLNLSFFLSEDHIKALEHNMMEACQDPTKKIVLVDMNADNTKNKIMVLMANSCIAKQDVEEFIEWKRNIILNHIYFDLECRNDYDEKNNVYYVGVIIKAARNRMCIVGGKENING